MTETLAYGYSSKSTTGMLSHEYQHGRVKMFFQKSFHPCALYEGSLRIGRVIIIEENHLDLYYL